MSSGVPVWPNGSILANDAILASIRRRELRGARKCSGFVPRIRLNGQTQRGRDCGGNHAQFTQFQFTQFQVTQFTEASRLPPPTGTTAAAGTAGAAISHSGIAGRVGIEAWIPVAIAVAGSAPSAVAACPTIAGRALTVLSVKSDATVLIEVASDATVLIEVASDATVLIEVTSRTTVLIKVTSRRPASRHAIIRAVAANPRVFILAKIATLLELLPRAG